MSARGTYSEKCADPSCSEWTRRENQTAREARRFPRSPWKCLRHSYPQEYLTPENPVRVTTLRSSQLPLSSDSSRMIPDALFWVAPGSTTGSGHAHGPGFMADTKDFPEGTVLEITVRAILPEPLEEQ
jgi:hypothetical protein